ncbi:MAG: DUF5916 domain-containing protein [Bacteroidota bacterium]
MLLNRSRILISLLSCSFITVSYSQDNPDIFPPPEVAPQIQAIRASGEIKIDGILDEPSWSNAIPITEFIQKDPIQGNPASRFTEAKVLFDGANLYIGAFCKTKEGKREILAQNLQRDFDYFQNDMFGVVLDGFIDKRNAVSFQTNPYGAQRELLVMDDEIFNREWSALWSVRTKITEEGWYAEMAIPWKTLRYPDNCKEMGILLTRNIRINNEYVSYPAVPRNFNVYRMPYEAILTGIEPPPPTANIQVNPYLLLNTNRQKENDIVVEDNTEVKAGGEIKWVMGPNSVLDLTYNTDFAQADVDRQVINLSRFSVFFPERRQFFLEGNEIYRMAAWDLLQPFFSRRIGLDDAGNPIPIEVGGRFTNRSPNQSIGGILLRQDDANGQPAANFAVARYSRNIGGQNRIGGMATFRYDEANAEGLSNYNTTVTIDGFLRPTQAINAFWMLSGSKNSGLEDNTGYSGALWAYYSDNLLYLGLVESVISEEYDPKVGFIDANNYLLTSPAMTLRLRPKWLPKFTREYSPGITTFFYHYLDDLSFREGFASFRPISFEFQNGSLIEYAYRLNWQSLRDPFSPLGIAIAAGDYNYQRHILSYTGDFSKKIGFSATYNFGEFFNGDLNTLTASLRLAPIPHISLNANYEYNKIASLGIDRTSTETNLLGTELRLSLNPRLQFITFYQYNTSNDSSTINSRLSWEYLPLSYLFIVFNDNRADGLNSALNPVRFQNTQGIVKLTFLKQF